MKTQYTKGEQIAASFRPFFLLELTTNTDINEVLQVLAKSIDNAIENVNNTIILKLKQFLSTIEYERLTAYQAECVESLERLIAKSNYPG